MTRYRPQPQATSLSTTEYKYLHSPYSIFFSCCLSQYHKLCHWNSNEIFPVLAVQVCQCISHTLDLFLEQVALLRVRELESENNRLRFGRGWIPNLFVGHEEIDFISSCREGRFSPSYHEHPVQCTVISLSQFHSGPHWSSLCIPTGIRFISEKPFLQLVLQLYNSQENFNSYTLLVLCMPWGNFVIVQLTKVGTMILKCLTN